MTSQQTLPFDANDSHQELKAEICSACLEHAHLTEMIVVLKISGALDAGRIRQLRCERLVVAKRIRRLRQELSVMDILSP